MTKTIDCIELKRRIQEQLVAKVANLTTEERAQHDARLIDADPDLARIWRSARTVPTKGKSRRPAHPS